MASKGGALFGVNLRDSTSDNHPFANTPISMIDSDVIADRSTSILLQDDPIAVHGGRVYELTGPGAITLSGKFTKAVASLRRWNTVDIDHVLVQSCSIEERAISAGIPVTSVKYIESFLRTFASYSTVTDTVQTLTGRPAKSVQV